MGRELRPCGTYPAYRRHIRHGEVPCESCYAANRERERLRREARGYVHGPYVKPGCGTNAGYYAHRYRREETCRACRDAHAKYKQQSKVKEMSDAA